MKTDPPRKHPGPPQPAGFSQRIVFKDPSARTVA